MTASALARTGRTAPRLATPGMVATAVIITIAGCAPAAGPRPEPIPEDPAVPAPASTTASSLESSFALITDYGSCDDGERKVAEMVASWPITMIATAGDNSQGQLGCTPFTESVDEFYGSFLGGSDGSRFFPVPGNHDYEDADAGEAAYLEHFHYLAAMNDDPRWYKVTTGNVNLFMIDSELGADDLELQKTWLQQAMADALASQPAFWNVVVFHRPPFTSGPHEPNTAMRPEAGWHFEEWGADLVVNGHQHVWEELDVDGLAYVVAGVGASDIARECPTDLVAESKGCVSALGAVLVTASTNQLTLDYRTPDGGAGESKAVVTVQR